MNQGICKMLITSREVQANSWIYLPQKLFQNHSFPKLSNTLDCDNRMFFVTAAEQGMNKD